MRCDISLLWSLGLGLTADLLTAGRCIDGFPAFGVFYYIDRRLGRLIVAEESGLRGCRIADEPALSTWMWKTVATSTNVTRMRRTSLAGLGRSTTTPSCDKREQEREREHANVSLHHPSNHNNNKDDSESFEPVWRRVPVMKTPQICFAETPVSDPWTRSSCGVPPDLLLNCSRAAQRTLPAFKAEDATRFTPALKEAAISKH